MELITELDDKNYFPKYCYMQTKTHNYAILSQMETRFCFNKLYFCMFEYCSVEKNTLHSRWCSKFLNKKHMVSYDCFRQQICMHMCVYPQGF